MVAPKRLMRQTESALCVQGCSGTAEVSWATNVIVNSKKFPTTYNTRSCTGGALLEGGGMTIQIVACSVEEN